MSQVIHLKTRSHASFRLQYHLILVVKYRHKCITGDMLSRMTDIVRDVLKSWGCDLIDMNGELDHIHVLFDAHPSLELARLVGNIKTVTSRYIRKEFSEHLKPYFWAKSYCLISSGGASIEVLKRYLKGQAHLNDARPTTNCCAI